MIVIAASILLSMQATAHAQLEYLVRAQKLPIPASADCHNQEARAFAQQGYILKSRDDPESALRAFSMAVRKEPTCVDALVGRADVYQTLDEFAKACTDLTAALKLSKIAPIYSRRALCYSALMKHDLAIADLTEAMKLAPKEISLRLFRADLYKRVKRYKESINDYSAAIKAQPKAHMHYYARAGAYRLNKQNDKALQDYAELIKLMPDDEQAYRLRAEVYRDTGDWKNAVKDYSTTIKLDPGGATPYLLERAKLYDKLNQPALAAQDRKKAQETKGHSGYLP